MCEGVLVMFGRALGGGMGICCQAVAGELSLLCSLSNEEGKYRISSCFQQQ